MSRTPEPFPPYRARYLPGMTPDQIAGLPDKAWAPVLIATGAIEQHGPHLPVAVDALMGQVWLGLALDRLPAGASCYVAPPITIGKSNEHTGFPGTLMISKGTLRALLLASARQIRAWGFRSLAVLNTHGGNTAVVLYTLREIQSTLGLRAELLAPKVDLGISEQERMYGYHAGEVETSWMLAVVPDRVRQEKARCEYPARIEDPGELRPEQAPAIVSWTAQDLSRSGIMGDATAASAEKGRRWLDLQSRAYADAIGRLCSEMKNSDAARRS